MILCDIGNTTYHFKIKKKYVRFSVESKLKELPDIKKTIYFISVNDRATKRFMKKYPQAINLNQIIKFDTKYQGMGIDRKVVCSGIKNGIVVDVGSAITVDVMENSKHTGGYILPGLSAYTKIYPQISKKLSFQFSNNINLDKIPLRTNDAINYAVINSIMLPILFMQKDLNLKIYLTGGDANKILHYFKKSNTIYQDDLMFKNMKKIIKRGK